MGVEKRWRGVILPSSLTVAALENASSDQHEGWNISRQYSFRNKAKYVLSKDSYPIVFPTVQYQTTEPLPSQAEEPKKIKRLGVFWSVFIAFITAIGGLDT